VGLFVGSYLVMGMSIVCAMELMWSFIRYIAKSLVLAAYILCGTLGAAQRCNSVVLQ